jgi:6-phosphogluconolactonase
MSNNWAIQSANTLIKTIKLVLTEKGECNIVLTGGNSAYELYSELALDPKFYELNSLNFYFGDERCVHDHHPDSNCKMAIDVLFSTKTPIGWSIYPINGNARSKEVEADRYTKLVSDDIDILLLGVGSDGHVASIFPESGLMNDMRVSVVSVLPCRGHLYERFTFTPQLISRAKIIFLLASTENKRALLLQCQKSHNINIKSMPVKLLLEGVGGFKGRGEVKIL